MAPLPLDMIQDEEAWLNDVERFMGQRGVTFDRNPKIGGRPIPLLKLYKVVMDSGGYDKLSAERMQWRALVRQFGFNHQAEGAMTFQLKTTYYKNLAAYEIAKYWGEQPPPPEILENLTAKGGDLRSRTVESFRVSGPRDAGSLADGVSSADEEQRTPKETVELDEPGSGSRYPSRQLRQDPKRTQLFQPDLSTPRHLRYPRTTTSPPPAIPPVQTYHHASADPRNPTFSVDRYEPRQPIALTLRPVVTPANNPEVFSQQKAMAKAQSLPRLPPDPNRLLRTSIPNNMTGPNIYLRCLYGLRSGISTEQDFALHHLVKVSFERGEKYKFEGFPLLAESLLEKALEITQIVYNFKWVVSYDQPGEEALPNSLNAAFGTPSLSERLSQLTAQDMVTGPFSAEDSLRLDKVSEAALVIRNMTILEENAAFISRFHLFRDFLLIALSLPKIPELLEFQHYALEMSEQVTRYWEMSPDDPLYLKLLDQIESNDRGTIICALRAICHIGMDTQNTHSILRVSTSTMERLMGLTLLDGDDELVSVCLDFIYQFTATPDNVSHTLESNPAFYSQAIPRLTHLLLHNATPNEERILAKPQQLPPPNQTIPTIPGFLHQQLIQLPEPERSSRWLRSCFEEDKTADITQIAIWQAYHGRFAQDNAMPAAEFIKNVSNAFSSAQAQVINGQPPKFIIRGIRPRRTLFDIAGRPLIKCTWEAQPSELFGTSDRLAGRHLCGQWQTDPKALWMHILVDHMNFRPELDGTFRARSDSVSLLCRWSTCTRTSPITSILEAGKHVKMHIPTSAEVASRMADEVGKKDAEFSKHTLYYTQIDEKNQPCGIPFMSVMILRNLARYANRHGDERQQEQPYTDQSTLMDRFFAHVKPRLWHVLTVNRTLSWYMTDLMKMIEKGETRVLDGKKGSAQASGVEVVRPA